MHDFNFKSQFVFGKKVKVPIYPQFSAAKICRIYLIIADMIDFNDIFCRRTFLLIQRAVVCWSWKLWQQLAIVPNGSKAESSI